MKQYDNLSFENAMSTNMTKPNQKPRIAVDAFKLVVFLLVMIATVTGNALVCMAVIKFKFLWTKTNLVLVSLAATDLCMVFVMAMNAATAVTADWPFGEDWCDVVASAGLTLAFISILHLCFLSVDRFVAIYKPFQYPQLVTRRRVSICLFFLWILPIVALHLPIADITFRGQVYGCSKRNHMPSKSQMFYTFILVVAFVALPFFVMFITHAYVFFIALRHARKLGTMERNVRTEVSNSQPDSNRSLRKAVCKSLDFRQLRREIKTAKTFAFLVSAFLLCYLPFFTVATYRKYVTTDSIAHGVMLFVTWLAFANSFCNPLLYGVRYATFRKAFKKLCCSYCITRGILAPISTQGESFVMTPAMPRA